MKKTTKSTYEKFIEDKKQKKLLDREYRDLLISDSNIRQALEVREDIYLSRIAEEAEIRAKEKAMVPAEKVWKALDLE